MSLYRVTWRQSESRSALVEADSADDAVEMASNGDYDDSTFLDAKGFDLVEVEEVHSYEGRAREPKAECDECGAPAPHCIGGESYYCNEHTPYDTFADG